MQVTQRFSVLLLHGRQLLPEVHKEPRYAGTWGRTTQSFPWGVSPEWAALRTELFHRAGELHV